MMAVPVFPSSGKRGGIVIHGKAGRRHNWPTWHRRLPDSNRRWIEIVRNVRNFRRCRLLPSQGEARFST
jgi:hypothetical protein